MQATTHNSHMESEVGSAMWVVLWAHAGALEKPPHLPIIHLRMNAKDYGPEESEKDYQIVGR